VPIQEIRGSTIPIMPWVWLIIAGILEIAWAIGLKYADGFTKLWPSVVTVLLMLASFWCLAQAVRALPLGTSYAIWTGIGAVGTAVLGMILFKEPATVARLLCIVLIVAGIVGLKLTMKG
jgi:quaternary ammonium compound-resistance protein SugE